MLFNSYPFIFVFLPLTLVGFFLLGKHNQRWAAAWLVAASFFFYGWWNPRYLALLAGSMVFNYLIGAALIKSQQTESSRHKCKLILNIGLLVDLGVLGYYKYANFFLENINTLTGVDWNIGTIILPLGVSFFTFTQIAFLVDAYRGEVRGYNFIHYALFITYFPHLIAGPILHHKEIIPQFSDPATYKCNINNLAAGITVFFIGLFKKSVLADSIAPHGVIVFMAAAKGQDLTFLETWIGVLCYTFQLYFDFSGYSDMAIGGSLLFGIKLPLNFHSPYKSVNIFEFWRRWHMTLSRFLREYVYSPLSYGKQKPWRLSMNLVITMLVGGLWHGAGWTYLVWGGLHGFYLTVNHIWRNLRRAMGDDIRRSTPLGRFIACFITFTAFVFSLAFFRAQDMAAAIQVARGMLGINGIALPLEWQHQLGPIEPALVWLGVSFQHLNGRFNEVGFTSDAFYWLFILGLLIWCTPNTQQIMGRHFPALAIYQGDKQAVSWLLWKPTILWSIAAALMAIIGLANITKVSEFLYYQF